MLVSIVGIFFFVGPNAWAVPLFSEDSAKVTALSTAASHEKYEAIKKHRGYRSITLRAVNSESISFKSETEIQNQLPTLEYNWGNGGTYKAILKRTFSQPGDVYSWAGRIEGDLNSIAVFTKHDGFFAGEVNAFGKVLSIKPVAQGLVAIRELLPEQMESQGDDQVIIDTPVLQNARAVAVEDDGTVIDMYVFYNDATAAASASITTEITNDISYTNTALDSSCAQTSIRVVGTQQLTFAESGAIGTDLSAFYDFYDGKADSVLTTMVNAGADMGQLWIESVSAAPVGSGAASACGVALTAIPYPSGTGYSIKVRTCSASTTAHEIGHNFTVLHDRFQCYSTKSQQNYPQESGWGYVNLHDKVRDLMSYTTECSAHGLSCTQLPYFSNPRMFINGRAFGVPGQTDAVRQINRNRHYLAKSRGAASTPTAPTFSLCKEAQVNEMKLDKCFIATAAYGSFLDPHVIRFRKFRDGTLGQTQYGRGLIESYYNVSPYWAEMLDQHAGFKPVVRAVLFVMLLFAENFAVFAIFMILAIIFFAAQGWRFFRRRHLPIALILFYASVGSAGYNNPSYFWGSPDGNPASLEVGRSIYAISVNSLSTSYALKSAVRDATTSKISSSLSGEGRFYSELFSLSAYSGMPETESFSRVMNEATTDSWDTKNEVYSVQAALGFGSSSSGGGKGPKKQSSGASRANALGVGYKSRKVKFTRVGITDSYGTKDTIRMEESGTATLGFRWELIPSVSMSGFADSTREVSTEVAAGNRVRAGGGFGYSGSADSFLKKLDATYLTSPEVTTFEASPYSTYFSPSKKGFNLDIEVAADFGGLFGTVGLGLEYESLEVLGFHREGTAAKETSQVVKAIVGILEDSILLRMESRQQGIKYEGMDEVRSSTTMGVSYLF